MSTAPTILSIVDTRTYEEVAEDRWAPIKGSGTESVCDRCGRSHEVHVHVRYDDGREAIVGTGCAQLGDAFNRSAATTSGSVARIAAQLRHAEALIAELDTAGRAAAAVPVPAHTVTPEPARDDPENKRGRVRWVIPGTTVFVIVDRWSDPTERFACLDASFRGHLVREALGDRTARAQRAAREVEDIRRRLARAEARLAKLVAQ